MKRKALTINIIPLLDEARKALEKTNESSWYLEVKESTILKHAYEKSLVGRDFVNYLLIFHS